MMPWQLHKTPLPFPFQNVYPICTPPRQPPNPKRGTATTSTPPTISLFLHKVPSLSLPPTVSVLYNQHPPPTLSSNNPTTHPPSQTHNRILQHSPTVPAPIDHLHYSYPHPHLPEMYIPHQPSRQQPLKKRPLSPVEHHVPPTALKAVPLPSFPDSPLSTLAKPTTIAPDNTTKPIFQKSLLNMSPHSEASTSPTNQHSTSASTPSEQQNNIVVQSSLSADDIDKMSITASSAMTTNQPNAQHFNHLSTLIQSDENSDNFLAVSRITNLIDNHFAAIAATLVPTICIQTRTWSPDLQSSAAKLLSHFLTPSVPAATLTTISQTAIDVLSSTTADDRPLYSWVDILIAVIPLCKSEDNLPHLAGVIPIIDRFTKENDFHFRKQAARILAPLSAALPPSIIATRLIPVAVNLLTDHDSQVRILAPDFCIPLLQTLRNHEDESTIWSLLAALLRDPSNRIHATALRAVAQTIKSCRQEDFSDAFRAFVPPLFVAECAFVQQGESSSGRRPNIEVCTIIRTFADEFGPVMHALHDYLSASQRDTVIGAFASIAGCRRPLVRRACVFNFPAVCLRFGNSHSERLGKLVEAWVRDDDSSTRLNLATCLHVCLKHVHRLRSREAMVNAFLRLLGDSNVNIRVTALHNAHRVMAELLMSGDAEDIARAEEWVVSLFALLSKVTAEVPWRTQVIILDELNRMLAILPRKILSEEVMSFLSSVSVRMSHAARRHVMVVIVKVLWQFAPGCERDGEVRRFVNEWAKASTFWKRMCFIEAARAAVHVFDRETFRNIMLPELFTLSADRIVNVRLRLARMMVDLAFVCGGTDMYRMALVKLSTDVDDDVRDELFSHVASPFLQRLLSPLRTVGEAKDVFYSSNGSDSGRNDKMERTQDVVTTETVEEDVSPSTGGVAVYGMMNVEQCAGTEDGVPGCGRCLRCEAEVDMRDTSDVLTSWDEDIVGDEAENEDSNSISYGSDVSMNEGEKVVGNDNETEKYRKAANEEAKVDVEKVTIIGREGTKVEAVVEKVMVSDISTKETKDDNNGQVGETSEATSEKSGNHSGTANGDGWTPRSPVSVVL